MCPCECEYKLNVPGASTLCGYYHDTLDEHGKRWANYPDCKKESCPIVNPELLEGRLHKNDITSVSKLVGFVSPNERQNKSCFFCGTTELVHYIVEVDMPSKMVEPTKVYTCNRCATIKIR